MFNIFRKKKIVENPEVEIPKLTLDSKEHSIKDFENKMKLYYKITQDVEFIYDREKSDHENMTLPAPAGEKQVITLGVKGYDLDNLTDKQKLKLYNTIVHEIIHLRDRESLPFDVQERLNSGQVRRTLGHFGYMIYDEYVAYRESNELYREEVCDLHSSEEQIVNVFYNHMLKKGLVMNRANNYRTDNDKPSFYRAFLDYCSALIALYILKTGLDGTSEEIKKLNSGVYLLEETYRDKGYTLSWNEYAELANKFITKIISDLSSDQRKTFKYNTEIIFEQV